MKSLENRLSSEPSQQETDSLQDPQSPEQMSLSQTPYQDTSIESPQDPQAFSPETPNTPAEKVVDVAQSMDTPSGGSDNSYVSSFIRGLERSASGEIAHPTRKVQEHIKSDPDFWTSLVEESGTIVGDMPYIMAGATIGAAAGGSLGSYAGPYGTAIGGVLGGGFGSMALPEFLKSSIQEYKDYVEQGNDLTFGEFLERADRIGSKTLNSGLMGSMLGMVNKAAPVLKKLPGIGKLFTSKIAQSAEKVAAEAAVLTTVPPVSEGRLPAKEDFAKSVALILGLKAAQLPAKVRERIEKSRVLGDTPETTAKKINDVMKKVDLEPKEQVSKEPVKPREKKVEADQETTKEIEAKSDIPEAKTEAKTVKEQRKDTETQKKVEEVKVKAFEEQVENKETNKIQKKIDSIEEQLKKATRESSKAVLNKNLSIQKKRLKAAQAASKYSVPQTPGEVNTKQKTLVAEIPENLNNTNVVEAVAKKPVETLSQGAYEPGDWYSSILGKSKKGLRKLLRVKGDPTSNIYKEGWEAVKRFSGGKKTGKYESNIKWDEAITKNKKISKQDRSDMIFYRERTGNPFVTGDTFEALNKRISPEAKRVVDTVVDQHMKDSLRIMNDAPFMKQKVTPRKEIEDIYIRHFYAGKIKKAQIDKAYDTIQNKFRTDNPFANKRTFTTFNDALKEAGLVPMYNDITKLLAAQDAIMNRVLSNNRLVHDLRAVEMNSGTKLIVRSNNKKLYQEAKQDGWVPFQDGYLRSYVSGKGKDGKLKWSITEGPALVHPDLASSLQGVFNKKLYNPGNAFVRAYDQINAVLNRNHVAGSAFHFNSLGESFTAKGGGLISMLRTPFWWKQGGELLKDSAIVKDMLTHGADIKLPSEAHLNQTKSFYKNFLRKLQVSKNPALKGIGNLADMVGPFTRLHNFLFYNFQPRMKAMQYQRNVEVMLKHFEKKGMHPNESLLKEIKEQSASAVNDQFGGQAWELIPILNDPRNRKGLSRFFAYPDWTVSAVREISQALTSDSPIRRKIGQRYIAEYLLGQAISTQLMSYASTGLTNKPDGSITWDPKKAHSTYQNEDPKKRNFFDFEMPKVYVTVAGEKIYLGRDEQGRLYHMHGGKKFKEILRYFHSPIAALFSKSNPLLQLGMKLAMDHTPSEEGIFPVRGVYVEGEYKPWDGTEKWTKERALSMVKEVGITSLPYSLQTMVNDFFDSKESWTNALSRMGLKFGISGAGAFSVSKGLSLRSSEPYFEKAHKIEDRRERNESLKALRVLLKGYGYKDRQIKTIETKTRRRVHGKKEKR
jgi:hypothetical protein